jgi:hypothetical protein
MPKKPWEAIEEHFSKVADPGRDRTKNHGTCVKEVHESGKLLAWNFRSQTCLTMKIVLSGSLSIFIPKDYSVPSASVR